jgi:integrase
MQRKAYQDTHIVLGNEDSLFKDFLDSLAPTTRRTYTCMIRKLIEYSGGITGQQLLDAKDEWEKRILIYLQWLKNQGYSDGYAITATCMIRSFYDFHRRPLILNRQARRKLREKNRATEDYLFSKDEVRSMANIGSLKEKYVLLVGISFGLRAEDFSEIRYRHYRTIKLDEETPIPLGVFATKKEHIQAYPFISTDARPLIKAIIESNKNAEDDRKVWTERPQQLTVILQNLAKKTGIEPHGKRIRFHNLRKYLCDRLASQTSESKWKQIVGKKTGESAYVSSSDLREAYKRAMPEICVIDIEKEREFESRIEKLEIDLEHLRGSLKEIDRNDLAEIVEELLKKKPR